MQNFFLEENTKIICFVERQRAIKALEYNAADGLDHYTLLSNLGATQHAHLKMFGELFS